VLAVSSPAGVELSIGVDVASRVDDALSAGFVAASDSGLALFGEEAEHPDVTGRAPNAHESASSERRERR
jgi:hypothetical protein